MKNIKFLGLFLMAILAFTACNPEEDDLVTGNATTGGLVSPSVSVNYVVGNPGPYTVGFRVFQGAVKTSQVKVSKQYIGSLGSSNEVDFKTVDITGSQTADYSMSFTYEDLREGLTVTGGGIPADDTQLAIGDKWVMSYTSITSNGTAVNSSTTEVIVSTRLAGTYEVIASDYYRLGVQSGAANWVGQERVIKSVNSTTYLHEGWGPFTTADFETALFYFTVNEGNGIDIPLEYDGEVQTGPGTYAITCVSNPNDFTHVSCAGSNIVVLDDETGRDILYLTYGYIVEGSGVREFYEVLKKKVE